MAHVIRNKAVASLVQRGPRHNFTLPDVIWLFESIGMFTEKRSLFSSSQDQNENLFPDRRMKVWKLGWKFATIACFDWPDRSQHIFSTNLVSKINVILNEPNSHFIIYCRCDRKLETPSTTLQWNGHGTKLERGKEGVPVAMVGKVPDLTLSVYSVRSKQLPILDMVGIPNLKEHLPSIDSDSKLRSICNQFYRFLFTRS